jgi:iron-sulfur cluster repair protein YtfE (RIC family)
MTEATERRHEHEALHERIAEIRLAARAIPFLSLDERRRLLARITDFLEETLLPHAEDEEQSFYPAVARALGRPRATGTMLRDHDAIREHVALLELTAPANEARLQELLYALYALISVHFWKEEVEYFPLLDRGDLTSLAQ